MPRHAAFHAARHHAIVAAAGAVAVEVVLPDAAIQKEFARGAGLLDRTGRADVIGGDGIAKDAERARTLDLSDVTRLHAEAFEERRLLDVSRFLIPRINLPGGRGDFVPLRILRG